MRVRSVAIMAHAAIGRIGRPAFPAPSDWRARNFMGNLGRIRPRDREGVSRRHSGAMRSIELRCAIAHRRISRFRVWSFGPSRNDEGWIASLTLAMTGWKRREKVNVFRRHCEEPTGRANARPMTGSATKQSILSLRGAMDCFASLAMTVPN